MNTWLTWLGAGVGVVALVVGAGGLLPETRSATAERSIRAPTAEIRRVILDVERQTDWRPGLAQVTRQSHTEWREVTTGGEVIVFRLEQDSPDRLVLSFSSDRGYTGQWIGTLTDGGPAGTRISVREQATITSPVGRILARLFFDPEAFARAYLDHLARRMERP